MGIAVIRIQGLRQRPKREMYLSPDVAYVLAFGGFLGLYWEFIRPGKIFPGVIGSLLVTVAFFSIWQNEPAPRGVLIVALSAILFGIEMLWQTWFVAALVGTVALVVGSLQLFDGALKIRPALAYVVSVIFGTVTTYLAFYSKKARKNKWADLSNPRQEHQ